MTDTAEQRTETPPPPVPPPQQHATISNSHHSFLIDIVKTHRTRHSGRSLYQHLCGTHDLLRQWGCEDAVCTAGLFHSIYGTQQFKHTSWPKNDREPIRKLIGPDAEMLAYLFCTLSRPPALFYVLEHIPNDTKRQLREIEAANLIEQRSTSRWLRRLLDTDISLRVKDGITKYLGTHG